ncbi:MAG: UbiA family prenyltransferase [Candidatus Hermodarchaeota archaeon]
MIEVSKMRVIFGDWRLGRIIMFTLITSSVTYSFGGSCLNIVLSGLIGAVLSAGGFYLDYLGDYKKDRESGKMKNPIAKGVLSPKSGFVIVILCLVLSAILGLLVNPWLLIPLSCVILVIIGLVNGILDTPFLRAFSLGALQGFYVLIGALAAYRFELGIIILALFLFFAMTGARALGDTRDLLHDKKTDTATIPKKYGVRIASYFLLVNEIISYFFALSAYETGIFSIGYLYCIVIIVVVGLPLTLIFVYRPTPKIGYTVNGLSMSIFSILFMLGMILGKL